MAEVIRAREEEPPSAEAEVADSSIRRLVLVRREQFLAGASQEPGELARGAPFRRYALATHGAQHGPENPGPLGGAAA